MKKANSAAGQIIDFIDCLLHGLFQRMLIGIFHQLKTLLHDGLGSFAFGNILGNDRIRIQRDAAVCV
jgi:hypothetical protein